MAKKTKLNNLHTFEIKQRDPEGMLHGANTLLLMDGKPVKGATKVTVEVGAREIGKITIELIGRARVLGSFSQVQLKDVLTK